MPNGSRVGYHTAVGVYASSPTDAIRQIKQALAAFPGDYRNFRISGRIIEA